MLCNYNILYISLLIIASISHRSVGFIATLAGFAGPLIVKVAPPASLMVALAGLGFTYLGIGQLVQTFAVGHLGPATY